MSTQEDIVFNLEINTESTMSKLRQVEFIIFRAIGLWARMCRMLGIPEDSPMMIAIDRIQKITMLIRGLHTAVIMLNAAQGPIGWAKAGIGVGTLMLSATEFSMDVGA